MIKKYVLLILAAAPMALFLLSADADATVIVGVIDKAGNRFYMGCDSQTTKILITAEGRKIVGYQQLPGKENKVIQTPHYLIGYSGDSRILKHLKKELPAYGLKPKNGQSAGEFIKHDLIEGVNRILSEKSLENIFCQLLIICGGELYSIELPDGLIEKHYSYMAIGSGADAALHSLMKSWNQHPYLRVLQALHDSDRYNKTVAPPYHIFKQHQ